jgi:tRNA nucleotidyltransferase/poly(A) polymerase
VHSLLEKFKVFAVNTGIADNAYIVGGAVRDILCGKEPVDVDIAVEGDAIAIAREFAAIEKASFVLMNQDFGTGRIVKNSLTLDLSRLHGDSIVLDLSERDITINAMALPLYFGCNPTVGLIDPLRGADDLAHGVVRMVSKENFIKDPLRLLRTYRFAAEPGFFIEDMTRGMLISLAHMISSVSVERVAAELRLILKFDESYRTIKAMADGGLLSGIFPVMTGRDVLKLYMEVERVLNDLSVCFPSSVLPYFGKPLLKPCLKLSCLFQSAEDAIDACIGLKMSIKEISYIGKTVEYRDTIEELFRDKKPLDSVEMISLLRQLGEDIYSVAVLTVARAGSGCASLVDYCRELILFYQRPFTDRLGLLPLVTGDDLISEFHIKPSPLFGDILGAVENMVLEGRVATREQALKVAGDMVDRLQ